MISRVVLAVLIGASFSFSQSPTPTPQTVPAKQYFIAIFSKGPAWDETKPANEQIGFREHSDNLRRLRADKRIPIGGRYADKGMVILEAKNTDEAQTEEQNVQNHLTHDLEILSKIERSLAELKNDIENLKKK